MKRIAVVGAGISGLACAYELKKAGFEVTVLEKNNFVGGRMATRIKDGFYFDIGATHLSKTYTEMVRWCEELNITWEPARFLKYQVFRNGKLPTLMKSVSFIALMRLALYMLFLKKKDIDFFDLSTCAGLDTDNAYDYMVRKCGQEATDYIADPFISSYELHQIRRISKAALIALQQSTKYHRADWYLHRTTGGMSALPEVLASKLTVHKNTAVSCIEAMKDHVEITATDKHRFDAVVCATTANIAKKILINPTLEQQSLLDGVEYSKAISVAFTVPVGTLGEGVMFWVPYKENQCISGYANEEMKGEQAIHNGRSLLCVWLHASFAEQIMNKSDEEIFSSVKKEFLKVCPLIADESVIQNHDLERWAEAMPSYYHGSITKVNAFLEKGQGENNIYLCGDYLNSPWTEGALRCGKRVAKAIIEDHRH